jgi:hypothetical protein
MTGPQQEFLAHEDLTVEAPDDVEAATAYAMQRGWGDGLPIVPPTLDRVERMLAYCERPWHEPVCALPPRDGELTPLRLAANAVMAGCRPEYFPLVLLALQAMCEPAFNLRGIQATTHPCAPLCIFNGPVARELGINGGHNAFGPGFPANATIGRTIRLALINIGGATPGIGDMATMGQPGKYAFVVAEHEEASPWEPLHVERGFAREQTTVTVVGAEAPFNVNDHFSKDAAGLLQMIAGTMRATGANNFYYRSDPVVAICPEHAKTIAAAGLSKAQVKRQLAAQCSVPLGSFSPENIAERFRRRDPARYADAPPDMPVSVLQDPDDLLVIVLGGAGKHSMYLPTFGATRAATRALVRADGRDVRSIEAFRS